jgi:hypothetical protein
MKYACVVVAALLVVGLCAGRAVSNGQNDGGEGFQISVAPGTIALGSPVDAVTVHSNIPAVLVVKGSVALNGVPLANVWADDRGHLAGRLALAALPGIAPPAATFTLTADLTDASSVAASDTVKVVQSNAR